MVPYSFRIKGGIEQNFETTAKKIERAKEIYFKLSSLARYVSIVDEKILIDAGSMKQINLVLDILKLPSPFPNIKNS